MNCYKMLFIKFFVVLLIAANNDFPGMAQTPGKKEIAELTARSGISSIPEFVEFLSIRNDGHFSDQITHNLDWLTLKFSELGFHTTILKGSNNPCFLAEKSNPSLKKTLLFYAHADGQPVDPSKWEQEDPFKPVLKAQNEQGDWEIIAWDRLNESPDPEWRIFARSSSDDKGPIMMLLVALRILQQEKIHLPFNLKVLIDLEEEMGSPGIVPMTEKYLKELKADYMLIFDGPKHYSHRPSLTFGARGISTITLTVFGPKMSLHSGHYGNYAPNPAFRLSQILGSMKDENGRVIIPGFYDHIRITDRTRELLKFVPDDIEQINRSIGIHSPDRVGLTYQEALQYPSLNIRGLSSGWTGDEVRTIIPDRATAEIDIRTVPECDPERLTGLVKQHIATLDYYIIDREPTDEERAEYPRIVAFHSGLGYSAYRTDLNSPLGIWLMQALNRASDEQPVRKRISGGSVPISPMISIMKIPAVNVPTVNPDNNQHSPNENLRLGNYLDGIKIFLAILSQPVD